MGSETEKTPLQFDRFPGIVATTMEGISTGWIELSQADIEALFGLEVREILRKGEAWFATFDYHQGESSVISGAGIMDHWSYESELILVDTDNPHLVGEHLTGRAVTGWELVTVCPVNERAIPGREMYVFATFRKCCEDHELHS